jgi:hypothetical protein
METSRLSLVRGQENRAQLGSENERQRASFRRALADAFPLVPKLLLGNAFREAPLRE